MALSLSHRSGDGFVFSIPNSYSRRRSHITSLDESLAAMYSDSIVERATIGCRRLYHVMAAPLRTNINPEVDRLVSESPPLSASEYPVRRLLPISSGHLLCLPSKHSPWFRVPARYFRTRFAAFQCVGPGFSQSFASCPAMKAMSGRTVMAAYIMLPTASR